MIETIEQFACLESTCPSCGEQMKFDFALWSRKCRNMNLKWVCTSCAATKHQMTLAFNRLLEREETRRIQVAIILLWDHHKSGQDTSQEKIDLVKLGVYCMYTVRYEDCTTGEKFVKEVDAREVIDLAELMQKLELQQLCIKYKDKLEAIRQRNIEAARLEIVQA